MRGNVDTRLRKLAEGEVDALVLALAGLERLNRAGDAGGIIDECVPAAGQGALALEARSGALDGGALAVNALQAAGALVDLFAGFSLAAIYDPLNQSQVAIFGRFYELIAVTLLWLSSLVGWVGLPDGSAWLRDAVTGDPAAVGRDCAERMLAAGAGELLRQAEAELTT